MYDAKAKFCMERLRTYFDYLEAKYSIAPMHRVEFDDRLRRLERSLAQSDADARHLR